MATILSKFNFLEKCSRNIPLKVNQSGSSYGAMLKESQDTFSKQKFNFSSPDSISYLDEFFDLSDKAVIKSFKSLERFDNTTANKILKNLADKEPKIQKKFLEKIAKAKDEKELSKISNSINLSTKKVAKGLSSKDKQSMANDAYFNNNRDIYDANFFEGNTNMQLGSKGEAFDAHGIAKGNALEQLETLDTLLKKGINPNKTFYTAPLDVATEKRAALGAALGTSGGTAYRHGSFILTAGKNKTIQEDGIKHVIVNKAFYNSIEKLKSAYPDVNFVKMCDAKDYFSML